MRDHEVGDHVVIYLSHVRPADGVCTRRGTVTKVRQGPYWNVTVVRDDDGSGEKGYHESLVHRG